MAGYEARVVRAVKGQGMPRGGEWVAVGCTRVFRLGGSRRPLGLFLPTHPPLSTRGTFWAIPFAVIFGHVVWCTGETRAARRECATVSPALHTSAPAYLTRLSTCVPTTLAVS
jgi:hypothetical protein